MEVIMVNVNIRMDNELKEQFADFCDNIGLSMSSLFNVFAKKVVKEKKVPFDLTYQEEYKTHAHDIIEAQQTI